MKHRLIVFLVLVGLMLRLGYSATRSTDLAALPDQQEYVQIAKSVLGGTGFSFLDERFGQQVVAFRMPGYPLFVAALGAEVFWVRIAQAVLDSSIIAAAYLLMLRMSRATIVEVSSASPSVVTWGLVAGGLVAVHPLLIHFSSLLLTETLTTVCLAWSLVLFTLHQKRALLLGAALLLAAAMCRPSFGLIFIVLVAGRILTLPVRWRVRMALGLCVALLAAVPYGLWGLRNHQLLGQWVFTTTNSGITLYDGFNPDADGSSNQAVFLQDMAYLSGMTEVDRDAYFRARAKVFMTQNPQAIPSLGVSKLMRTFSPVPLSAENRNPVYWAAGLGFLLPIMLAAAGGLYQSVIHPRFRLALIVPIALIGVLHVATVGSLRYRVPVEPMICVLAAGLLPTLRRSNLPLAVRQMA